MQEYVIWLFNLSLVWFVKTARMFLNFYFISEFFYNLLYKSFLFLGLFFYIIELLLYVGCY